jgi:NhaP-type Na+/H+ or K+/H+ antiporter
VLGLVVVAEAPLLDGRDEIGVVVALTVLLSVLLHGVTAAPLSAVYVRRVEGMAASAPEKREMGKLPTRVGSVSSNDSEATMPPNATSRRKEPDTLLAIPVAEIIRIVVTELLAYRRTTQEANEPAVASSSPPGTSE